MLRTSLILIVALASAFARNTPPVTAIRVVIPTNSQAPVTVFQCVDTPGSCRLVPIDPGVDAPVYLSFYGTGISGRSSLTNVNVTVDGVTSNPVQIQIA